MNDFAEHRKYQRCESKICKVEMSTNGLEWDWVELRDISAGGLKFVSETTYPFGSKVQFDLYVYSACSEFNMKLQGGIIRYERQKGINMYAVAFDSMDKCKRVQLDEIVKSKITVEENNKCAHEDGAYSFLFLPRVRTSKIKMLR